MQEILTILLPIILALAGVLCLVIFIIRRLLLGDTLRAVERIKQVEADVRKKEEAVRRDIDEHEKEFARKKAEAEAELQKHKEESEKEVSRLKDQTIADARKEADVIMTQARKNEEKLRQQVLREMEEKAIDYGGQVFKLVFSEKINQELNRFFVDELLDALEEVDGASITVSAEDADFTSSHPLDPEQKKRLQTLLSDKFGVNVEIQEKVDESILAGLIFKLGSLEIDGSLINRYREAVEEIKKGGA